MNHPKNSPFLFLTKKIPQELHRYRCRSNFTKVPISFSRKILTSRRTCLWKVPRDGNKNFEFYSPNFTIIKYKITFR